MTEELILKKYEELCLLVELKEKEISIIKSNWQKLNDEGYTNLDIKKMIKVLDLEKATLVKQLNYYKDKSIGLEMKK